MADGTNRQHIELMSETSFIIIIQPQKNAKENKMKLIGKHKSLNSQLNVRRP